MDRIALSKRLEGLSSVFAETTPYRKELSAMSVALTKMADDKFQSVLDAGYVADEAAMQPEGAAPYSFGGPAPTQSVGLGGARSRLHGPAQGTGKVKSKEQFMADFAAMFGDGAAKEIAPIIQKYERMPAPQDVAQIPGLTKSADEKEASDESTGMYWNREASEAVLNNLLRDVCGMEKAICCDTKRKLDKEQVPEASHAGLPDKPTSLKPEQTPDLKDVIKSDMVAKSKKTPLRKEATDKVANGDEGSEEKEEKEDEPSEGAKKMKEQKIEKHEDEAEELKDEAKEHAQDAKKTLEKAEEHEEKAEEVAKESTSFDFEGIELTAGMEDVELTAEEAVKLSKLF